MKGLFKSLFGVLFIVYAPWNALFPLYVSFWVVKLFFVLQAIYIFDYERVRFNTWVCRPITWLSSFLASFGVCTHWFLFEEDGLNYMGELLNVVFDYWIFSAATLWRPIFTGIILGTVNIFIFSESHLSNASCIVAALCWFLCERILSSSSWLKARASLIFYLSFCLKVVILFYMSWLSYWSGFDSSWYSSGIT